MLLLDSFKTFTHASVRLLSPALSLLRPFSPFFIYLTVCALGSSVATNTMADQQQHKDTNGVIEQEPLTGLNLISDATANANTSKKSTALTEVDPNSVSNVNGNISVNSNSKSTTDPKKVSMAEPNNETGGVNKNLEVAGDDHENRLGDDIDGANMQMGVGGKKKKSKKKPKSQRGLVRFSLSLRKLVANVGLVCRTIQQDSRSTTLILPSHQPSMKKRRAYTICE